MSTWQDVVVALDAIDRAEPGYHHGNLRDALLRHGVELARTGGPEAVSIRAVQRLAGVSNAAAYRHYADRYALLQAIGNYASRSMADAMADSMAAAAEPGEDPVDVALARLRACGAAYLTFALTEPGLFAVAFLPDLPDDDHANPPPEARNAAGLGPFQMLQQCLNDLETTGVIAAGDEELTGVAAWSAVHGLAVLINSGPLRGLPPSHRDAAIARLLEIIGGGIVMTGRRGDTKSPP